jgi:uncharacterized membrane protein
MVHGDKYLVQHAPKPMADAVHGMEGFMLSFVSTKKKEEPAVVVTPEPAKPAAQPAVKAPEVKAAPAPSPAPTPAVAAAAGTKLAFQDVILPLLEAKCNSCHSDQKSKGKLKMHTYDDLMKGGSDGATTVIAGKAADSLAIVRLKLPLDDDEHMPPEEKDQFTKEEAALLEWWIQAGASATQDIAAIPAELKATADSLMKSN